MITKNERILVSWMSIDPLNVAQVLIALLPVLSLGVKTQLRDKIRADMVAYNNRLRADMIDEDAENIDF